MAGCKVIGIFGGVGSGKSIVTEYLHNKYNAYVIKADDVAKNLYRRGRHGYKAVIRIVGKSVLDEQLEINRPKLADILYSDPGKLKQINNAIHPMVYRKTIELIDSYKKTHTHGLVVYEAALISDRIPEFIDEFWYIYSPSSVRSERLRNDRGYTQDRINEIMNSQPSEDEYKSFCNITIENTGSFSDLEEKTDEIIKHSQRQQR
ncbi:MAG: dephospho-CoA kinase [Lachnospiraceae bacterium]|nr:dephospho-CoA kinase [Candidatus Darwinimomas equi]